MNKTQKGAWLTLMVSLFLLFFGICLLVEVVIFKKLFITFHRFYALLLVPMFVILLIFFCRKQSQAEVESDERDNLITKRAILVSFVSTWVLLAAVCIIPRFIIGYTGSIPVWILSIVNFTVFLIAIFIYSVAVLIQYGREGKDGQ